MNIDRLILSALLILGVLLVARLTAAYARRTIRLRARAGRPASPARPGSPILLYFWTSTCAQCIPQEEQIREVRALLARTGKGVEVKKINAFEEEALARSMHVLTVPTTVLLDGGGRITAWNPGLTGAQQLHAQIEKTIGRK